MSAVRIFSIEISRISSDSILQRLHDGCGPWRFSKKFPRPSLVNPVPVRGSAKAIRIISTAKFPSEEDDDMKSYLKPMTIIPTRSDTSSTPPAFSGPRTSLPTRFDAPIQHPDDLLACFHVRDVAVSPLGVALAETGLDHAPSSLRHVDSFLLFNTTENSYRHYRLPGKAGRINDKHHHLRQTGRFLLFSVNLDHSGYRRSRPAPGLGRHILYPFFLKIHCLRFLTREHTEVSNELRVDTYTKMPTIHDLLNKLKEFPCKIHFSSRCDDICDERMTIRLPERERSAAERLGRPQRSVVVFTSSSEISNSFQF
ncbi:putative WAS protein family 4 [Folsomia candida]|uniref:Putative WAS protein family 4 n=1 Tax=Folsomia candida TaxID=158441 RepID=A0A226D653_FOLCA|nr:putative WAS protein family 4 [Folsomia candida]